MRLIIREYLSMLKESGELDALLPDLLLSLGIKPLNRPGIGVRQFGVDIPAVGIDPVDNKRKLFLITVKQGDINRDVWDSGKQAVRQSLNEILDSYLRMYVQPGHERLPKKIVLATGGDLKQDVAPDWNNYTHQHTGKHAKYGQIEFEFWGADHIADLIEEYFLDEYLFPEAAQKQLRKTIALADQNEVEPQHFYAFVEATLFERDLPSARTASARRKRQHALRLLNLSLSIVFHWCNEADNLRPALLCAERVVLRTWDWMRQNKVLQEETTLNEYVRLFIGYRNVSCAYVMKSLPYCLVRDGLFWHGLDTTEYPLRTFDLIGIFGIEIIGLIWYCNRIDEDKRAQIADLIHGLTQTLIALINNNPAALNPRFDGHAIDISIGLLALYNSGYHDDARKWVEALARRVVFAYQMGRHFPISTDSYEDLVAMSTGDGPPKEKLMELSTLLPMLAEWHAVLDIHTYDAFQQAVTAVFVQTDLQTWYPDNTTDEHLYRTNAGWESGATLSAIKLPETLEKLRDWVIQIHKQRNVSDKLSCIAHGFPILGLLASRHFRTPVMPFYWQSLTQDPASAQSKNDE